MYISDKHLPLAVIERELEFVMLDTPAHRRPETLAVGVRAAKHAGAAAARLAALTGMSRQAVYDALGRDTPHLPSGLELVIAASLAGSAQTPASLAGLLKVPIAELAPVIEHLVHDHLVKVATADDNTQVLLGGERAEASFRRHLEDRRWVRLERYSVYARLAEGETAGMREAAPRVLGAGQFAILPKGVASHVRTDELAFAVGAADRREALETAQALWTQIRKSSGLPLTDLPLADIIDPVRRAA